MTGGAVISSGDTESVVPVVSGGWAIYIINQKEVL